MEMLTNTCDRYFILAATHTQTDTLGASHTAHTARHTTLWWNNVIHTGQHPESPGGRQGCGAWCTDAPAGPQVLRVHAPWPLQSTEAVAPARRSSRLAT